MRKHEHGALALRFYDIRGPENLDQTVPRHRNDGLIGLMSASLPIFFVVSKAYSGHI
jgi:hypothetical protein